ncbi:MAG: hypothetical protein WDW38_001013 [Sanguina aurantia]
MIRESDQITTHETESAVDLPRYDVENDKRYRRVDSSEVHAFEARQAFATLLVDGEHKLMLAEASLQITAEDDALASHSTVRFPVASFLSRVSRMTRECAMRLEAATQSAVASGTLPEGERVLSPEQAMGVVCQYLSVEQRIKVSKGGRSSIPPRSVVDHPGVWEDARGGYLNELLVRRTGHPAAVALLYAEVMKGLLNFGAINFAITVDPRFDGPPRMLVIPGMTRQMLQFISLDEQEQSSGVLNTCTSEVLLETLRFLKRAYWPFPWDTSIDAHERGGTGSHGGFRLPAGGLSVGSGPVPGQGTSAGVGLHERLVMMLGDSAGEERRDLAVILVHAGEIGAARAELRTYMAGNRGQESDPFDTLLCSKLASLLATAANVAEPASVMSVEHVLRLPSPQVSEDRKMPSRDIELPSSGASAQWTRIATEQAPPPDTCDPIHRVMTHGTGSSIPIITHVTPVHCALNTVRHACMPPPARHMLRDP